ncbi:MAG: DUF308 domain-containing protein [Bacilli bacterium]|nr:DUF308 domain-containing protein [Bacilli bacterium]
MEKLMKKFFRSSLITSLFLIALGLLLIFQSDAVIYSISYIIGGILIAIGVLAIIKFIQNTNNEQKAELDIVYGIVSVILGIIVIKNPQAIASIIPAILGISIVISSATKLQYAFELKANGNNLWKTTMVISIISTLCGIVLLFNPFKALSSFTKVVGIFIVIYAVLDMISTFTIKRNVKIFQKTMREGITEALVIKEELEEVNTKDNSEESNKKEEKKKVKK